MNSKIVLVVALLIPVLSTMGVSADEKKPANKDKIGRYQIVGEWRLDTMTGELEKIEIVYQRQMEIVAKEIRKLLADGETLRSVEDTTFYYSNPMPVSSRIIRINPLDRPATLRDLQGYVRKPQHPSMFLPSR